MGVGDHDPVLLAVHLDGAMEGLPFLRLAVGDPVELPLRSLVPGEVPGVHAVVEDPAHRGQAPGPIEVGLRVRAPRGQDTLLVKVKGDGPKPHSEVGIHLEDPLHRADTVGRARDEPRPIGLGGAEAFPGWHRPDKDALDGEDLLLRVRHEPNALVGAAGSVGVLKVIPVGRHPAAPGSCARVAHEPPDGDLAEVLDELAGLPLLDAEDEVVGVGPGEVLVAVDDLDAGLAELVAQVPRLVQVTPGEAGDVEHKHVAPVPFRRSGGLDHLLEGGPGIDGGPADCVVLEPPGNPVPVPVGVGLDDAALVAERLLLPVGRPADVGHGGPEGSVWPGGLVLHASYLIIHPTLPWLRDQHQGDSASPPLASSPRRVRLSGQRR